MSRSWFMVTAAAAVALGGCGTSSNSSSSTKTPAASAPATPFLQQLTHVSTLTSTVPANGDVNPYGLALVLSDAGNLHAGSLLISNFNGKSNNQGTGTTIVQITPAGQMSLFADITAKSLPGSCPGGVGLTTALSVIPGGYVVVGSLPTTDGKSATAKLGCLIVLDSSGKPVSTIAGRLIQGPWDMTATTQGSTTTLFVSTVLNGGADDGVHTVRNSTVVRVALDTSSGRAPKVLSEKVIADKIPWRDDPNALAIGPTGVALSSNGTLYLADTLENRISAIPQALTRNTAAVDGGVTVSKGAALKQPLGLAVAPGGDILTTNAGDGNIVETTPTGKQVLTRLADKKTGAGSLFGLVPSATGLYYVDDGDNTLKLLTPAAAGAAVKTASSSQLGGTILVDAQGMTLYALSAEHGGKFVCTSASCLAAWHPLTGTPSGSVGSLGTVKRPDGTEQVTYKGRPLYTFASDSSPGQTHGQGIKDVGTWSAVVTQHSRTAAASSSSSGSSSGYSSGGGGY